MGGLKNSTKGLGFPSDTFKQFPSPGLFPLQVYPQPIS